MKKNKSYFLVFGLLFFGLSLFSQIQSFKQSPIALIKPNSFVKGNDVFGGRAFIENKGQFKDINNSRVLFALDNGLEKIYFTKKGLVYELTKVFPMTERQMEGMEHGKPNAIKPSKFYFVNMNWAGSNSDIRVEPSEKQSYYITYGARELNASTFKKIIYKNVYNGIDIEYSIPEDKSSGIKYSLLIHPGANAADVKIIYSGSVGRIKLKKEEIIIKTPLDDIIEHIPHSYYESGELVTSLFKLNGDTIGYEFPQGYNKNKTLIIDPWVTTIVSLTTNNYAYDVDYDFLGNTYVYGGYSPFKVACYSSSGVLQWVFAGIVTSPSWSSSPIISQASNFGIDKFTSKTYIGQGFVSAGNRLIRLDALGNYDNFINAANPLFEEVWDIGFHCTSADVFVLGGGTSSNISAVTMNSLTSVIALSTFQPLNSGFAQDIVSHAIDDAANIFVIYAGGGLNNKICLVNPGFNNNIWTQSSGFTSFSEQGNKSQYVGAPGLSSNGFNALAVNANYLYYYDGFNLAAFNKSTGLLVSSTTISGNTLKQQGGIAVDDCNNLYIGGNGSILTYSYNGIAFTPQTPILLSTSSTNQYVYDIKLDKQSKVLYVSGSGFVGVYSPVNTLACVSASSACLFSQGGISVSTTSVTCASLGSATCTAAGGVGPFTYTWLPSMQTSSVATGLNPGVHAIVVHDIGNNNTYTATAYLSPLVAFTGTVPNPVVLDCFGATNGTAAVNNLSGGSGNQTYSWTNGTTTQTTPIATGLGLGIYTVSIVDALTACAINQTFAVTQPPTLTINVLASSLSACANTSISLGAFVGGGTPNYSYSWTAGPTTPTYAATQSLPGSHVFTLTALDSKSCAIVYTLSLNFTSTPTLALSNVSICPQGVGTLTVSGANAYTWTSTSPPSSFTGSTFTDNPLATTVYTVVGAGANCNASASVSIIVLPVPIPTLTSNSPVCSGHALQLNAFGGSTYKWDGPFGYTSTQQQAIINPATPVNSGVYTATITGANTCTATATQTALVYTAPLISAVGSTVCVTQTINLAATSSFTGCTYFWSGPNSFTSNLQNPSINNPSVNLSGNYSLIVTDANGCVSTAAANVTVTAMPVPSFTSNSPLCAGKTLTLNANATSGGGSYNWIGPNGFASTLQNPQLNNITASANGVYTLVVIAGPCITSTFNPVVVYPPPAVTIVGVPNVCETKILALNIVTSANIISYSWFGPLGFSSSLPNIVRAPATSTFSGIYTAVVTDSNSCSNTTTISVNILANPVMVAPDVTVCLHEPAILNASGATSYFWTGPAFFQSSNQNALISYADNIAQVFYTVTGTAANSCTSIAIVGLSTLPLPLPSLSILPGPVLCVNDQVNFTGFGGKNYQWRGPGEIYFEGKTLNFKMSGFFREGTYTLTAIDSMGCKASTDTLLIVNQLPTGVLQKISPESCIPFCSDFYFTASASSSVTSNWQINTDLRSGNTFSYCFNTAGTYTLTASVYDAITTCSNILDFYVVTHPKPKADFIFTPDKPVENMDVVIFTNTSQGEELNKFNWFFINDKGFTSTAKNTSYLFDTEGQYPVALIVKNKWDCVDSVVKLVKVEADFGIYVPDAFTPNGDDLNELFLPIIRAGRLYHLSVFDRWGTLLFETSTITTGWDGTYKGQPCKSDVYVWTILISTNDGLSKKLKGHVTLYK